MAERGTATLAGSATNGVRPSGPSGRSVGSGGRSKGTGGWRGRGAQVRSRVRVPELALGVMLVAGGALGAVLWATHEPTQRVLVAARSIQRGESVDATMLRWAVVSGDRITAIDVTEGLGGRIAAVDIAAGSPLQDVLFQPPTSIGAGQIEYGLALDPGDFPVGLGVGDVVEVVAVPAPDATGTASEPITLAVAAEVLVAPGADLAPGQKAVVNLLIARGDAPVLATAIEVKLGRVSDSGPEPGSGAEPGSGSEPGSGPTRGD